MKRRGFLRLSVCAELSWSGVRRCVKGNASPLGGNACRRFVV